MASLNSHETTKGMRVKFQDVECYREYQLDYPDSGEAEEPKEFTMWKPPSMEDIKKEEEKPTPKSAVVDIYTDIFAEEWGLRSMKSQTDSDMEKLDLSFLDDDTIDEPDQPKPNTMNETLLSNGVETDGVNLPVLDSLSDNTTRVQNTSAASILNSSSTSTTENTTVSYNKSLKNESLTTSSNVSQNASNPDNDAVSDTKNTTFHNATESSAAGNVSAEITNLRVTAPETANLKVTEQQTTNDTAEQETTNVTAAEQETTNDTAEQETTNDTDSRTRNYKRYRSRTRNYERYRSRTRNYKRYSSRTRNYERYRSRTRNYKRYSSRTRNYKRYSSRTRNYKRYSSRTRNYERYSSRTTNYKRYSSTEQETTNVTAAEQETTIVTAAEQQTTIVTAAEQETTNVTAAEQETTNVTAAEQETTNVTAAEQETTNVTAAEQETTNLTLTVQQSANLTPPGNVSSLLETLAGDNRTSAATILAEDSEERLTRGDVFSYSEAQSNTNSSLSLPETQRKDENNTATDMSADATLSSLDAGEFNVSSTDRYNLTILVSEVENNRSSGVESLRTGAELENKPHSNLSRSNSSGLRNETSSAETNGDGNSSRSSGGVRTGSSEELSASVSSEEVLIYLRENDMEVIKSTSVKTQGHNWTYEGTHQTEPMEIPDHMVKYFPRPSPRTTPAPKRKVKTVHYRQWPQKGEGMKTKRRKVYKPLAGSSLPFSPRGFNPAMTPRGARPNMPVPVSDEEELINMPVVIGVPRHDFSDYELYVPGDEPNHLGLDEQDVKANEYEYVVYKDPYSSHEDVKNLYLDETAKYILKYSGPNVRTYFIAAEEVKWDYSGYGQR